jgi:hypothetical protein
MGARRRNSGHEKSRYRRVSLNKANPETGKVRCKTVKQILHPFWTSAEIVEAPLGPMGLPTGPNLVAKPGATIRKVVDHLGRTGYCHTQQYEKAMAQIREEKSKMIEASTEVEVVEAVIDEAKDL